MDIQHMESFWPFVQRFAIDVVVAFIILGIGWTVSKWLGNMVQRLSTRSERIDPTIIPMFRTVMIWSVRIVTIIAVLSQFGVQTASLIAVLGAAGLAIGLALQGTLQNIAAGIMLLGLRPLRVGESVTVASGISGTVDEVGLFLTRIVQADGVQVTVPNSTVWNGTIINLSRHHNRRMDIPAYICFGDNVNRAIEVLNKLIDEQPGALKMPAPAVFVADRKDGTITLTLRVWASADNFFNVQNDLNREVQMRLKTEGFDVPAPLRVTVHPPQGNGAGDAK
ncbi:mechanosensitive ion channel protein MscS [Advenella sp. S44]|uniref:mechanosensitive ion channel family protein n=1 Tax=Advenella sp. S44 TaxID=1982755 RepID=UPI000C2A6DAF|nr:mechanosensitive ion channel family protein [Advenella sp. S44]PJX22274.1 mechanosensitive ion channel protein MscS [Advenella sp. S44]